MKTLIDESRTLYAAIQSCCPDGAVERFVISYTSEQALRELLAPRSIVASGCTTRERAEELSRGEALRSIEINHESRSRRRRCRDIEPRNTNAPRSYALATTRRGSVKDLPHDSRASSSVVGISFRRKPRQRNSDPPSR